MGASLRSNLLAGFVASSIWMFISVVVDASKASVLIGGVVFLVGTAVITAVISAMMSRGRPSAGAPRHHGGGR